MLKKLLLKKSNIFVVLLFILACLFSYYLYSQTLGILHSQYRLIKNIPSTDLSGIKINRYTLGQPFSGEHIYGNGIYTDDEGNIVELLYYFSPYASKRQNANILTNTITNNDANIGLMLQTVKDNLGNNYQIVSDRNFHDEAIVYIDHENKLMLLERLYYGAAVGRFTTINLQPLDYKQAVAFPTGNILFFVLGMPLNIMSTLNGTPQALSFYIYFPFYCLLLFAPLIYFITTRKKRLLILPSLLATQWAIWWILINTYGAMR